MDRLRGLAVLAMIVAHTAGAWLRADVRGSRYWHGAMWLSGLAAPVFLFLVGVSLALVARRAEPPAGGDAGAASGPARWRLLRRGLWIWALGYLLHVGYWAADRFWGPWTRVLRVDVLHCIGAGLVVLPWLLWPRGRVAWGALGAYVVLGVAGQAVNYVPFEAMLPAGLSGYLTQKSVHGLFPFVPYWAYVALGVVVGYAWANRRTDGRQEFRFWLVLAGGAVLLYLASRWVHWAYYAWWVRIPSVDVLGRPTRGLLYVLLEKSAWVLGFFVAVRAVSFVLDRIRWQPVVLLGQTSLFVYGVHLFFIYHFVGKGLRGRLGPAEHAGAAAVLAAGMLGLAWGWRRARPEVRRHARALWQRVAAAVSDARGTASAGAGCAPVASTRAPRSPSEN